ncbi:MAG: Gfo/Idh/MocA family oxidoreductase [Phycisphaerales bacterium]|nr:Gfo/Idh/MocA family oxidoreductase [Phycisphaerales bacterium]
MAIELPQDSMLPNRRRFIAGSLSAAAAAALVLPWSRRAFALGPNGNLNIAAFGVGGMGGTDINSIAAHPKAHFTLFCDVDANRLKGACDKFPDAKPFSDYREAFAASTDSFDAVVCSTPDHTHGPVGMLALNAGKALYCQKPLTHSIAEARALTLAAARAKVATQMGIQGQAKDGRRLAVKMLQAGIYGKVVSIHIWTDRPMGLWPQGRPRPTGNDPVPPDFNWNCWLGVAPERSFVKDTYAPFIWRGFFDFGTGALGDMGCHFFDTPTAGLGLGAPISVQADVQTESNDQWPLAETVTFTFDGSKNGAASTFPLTWYDGGRMPAATVSPHLPAGWTPPSDSSEGGTLVVGTDCTVFHSYSGVTKVFPESALQRFNAPKIEPLNHWFAWVDSALGQGTTAASFSFSGPMTETILVGTVAGRVPGVLLMWDAAAMRFTNLEAANAFVSPKYRQGFSVPGIGAG